MNSSKLKAIIKDIFIKYKLSKDHASICAEALINAELVGAPSHGLSRLKMYCDRISKKVINWTLSNRNRRSKVPMKTSPDADPERVIELFNKIALEHPNTSREPAPKTYFYGYGPDGNLNFALMYWTTFSDTLKTDSSIALAIFKALKEEGISAPAPVRRIIQESPRNLEE